MDDYCQGKSREQETRDGMLMLCLVMVVLVAALAILALAWVLP